MLKIKKFLKVIFTGALIFAATTQTVFADIIVPTTKPNTNISSGSADITMPHPGLNAVTIIIICGAAIAVIWLVSFLLLRYFKKKK